MFFNDFVRLYTFISYRKELSFFFLLHFFLGYFLQFAFSHFHLDLLFIVYLIIFCIVKWLIFLFLRFSSYGLWSGNRAVFGLAFKPLCKWGYIPGILTGFMALWICSGTCKCRRVSNGLELQMSGKKSLILN